MHDSSIGHILGCQCLAVICCLRYFNAAGYDNRGRITMPEKNVDNLLPIVMEVASGKRKK